MKHQNISVIENGIKITLNLGRQGEYNVRDIKFDMSDFQQKYGDGTATIVHFPANGSAYTVPSISGDTKDSAVLDSNNIFTWTIGRLATMYDGYGIAEITWLTADGLKKSIRYDTYCRESIGDYGADRTAQQSYIDQMIELASTITDLSSEFSDAERIAAEISDARENAVSDIETLESNVIGSINNAKSESIEDIGDSKESALDALNTAKQTALSDVESAKQDAETDINAEILIAETHANNANQSATSASNSADSASQSATNASQFADNASNSATSASQFADNASSSANSASQSATSAQTSATNASTSEQNARQSAEDAQDILDSVQAEGNTQIGRVQAKGDEIIESLPDDFTQVQNDIAALNGSLDDLNSTVFEYRKKTQTLNVTTTNITASTHVMDVSIASGMRYRIKIDDPSGIVNNHVLTVYWANGSGDRTSLGTLKTGVVYEFIASENIAYFTVYKASNTITPPGNLETTCEYMTGDSQNSVERHMQDLDRQVGNKSTTKSVVYESGAVNLPIDYFEDAGKIIGILPSGSFKSVVTTLYIRYVGAESNTNLGNIAVGSKTYVRLPAAIEKVIVYSASANVGTITLAVRTVGMEDSIATYGNILKGKKLNYLGDSITYGGAYNPFTIYLSNVYDCTARNYGIAGSTIQYDADRNPMSVRYADMNDDAEIVACMGGTNDYWNNLPLGQMGDTTYNTFYGALDVLIQGIIAKYPTAFFYMVTPPQGYNGGNFDGEAKSNAGSMQDIANAVKEVSAKYGVPVMDVFNEGGLYPKIQAQYDAYYADGVHLNTTGQQKLAQMHYKFIESHYIGAVPTVLVPPAP